MTQPPRYRLISKPDMQLVYTSTARGKDGIQECVTWIISHGTGSGYNFVESTD